MSGSWVEQQQTQEEDQESVPLNHDCDLKSETGLLRCQANLGADCLPTPPLCVFAIFRLNCGLPLLPDAAECNNAVSHLISSHRIAAMPSQSPAGSGASTPYLAQTEEERAEREHQQEVDLQLATSMSRGLDAAAAAAASALARSRSRSGGQEMQRNDLGETYRSLRDAQVC